MPSKGLKKEQGDRHEAYLIEVLGGRQSRGSGNQWHAQMDGRHSHYTEEFAFAWDGKSTVTGTISVTLPMWEKALEQAGGERAMLALRWYPTERPTVQNQGGVDLACLSLLDLSELLAAARSRADLVRALGDALAQHVEYDDLANAIKHLMEEHS